jgi:hypothetical protein
MNSHQEEVNKGNESSSSDRNDAFTVISRIVRIVESDAQAQHSNSSIDNTAESTQAPGFIDQRNLRLALADLIREALDIIWDDSFSCCEDGLQ